LLLRTQVNRRLVLRAGQAMFVVAAVLLVIQFVRKFRFSPGDTAVYTLGFPALAALFGATVVILLLLPAQSISVRIFASKTLRFFGRYSYGLYVWHHIV